MEVACVMVPHAGRGRLPPCPPHPCRSPVLPPPRPPDAAAAVVHMHAATATSSNTTATSERLRLRRRIGVGMQSRVRVRVRVRMALWRHGRRGDMGMVSACPGAAYDQRRVRRNMCKTVVTGVPHCSATPPTIHAPCLWPFPPPGLGCVVYVFLFARAKKGSLFGV